LILLGIDPGSRFCGYGILQLEQGKIVAAGCDHITIDPALSLPERLSYIYQEMDSIVRTYKPNVAAVESIFYGKNIQSAFTLGHVRGVLLLLLANYGLDIASYSPKEVKKSVVGNGNATKQQVKYMVQKSLQLSKEPPSEDAADGLALALCHYNKIRFELKAASAKRKRALRKG
jgi:crossover junction endodeoxyribonuclease RuvC